MNVKRDDRTKALGMMTVRVLPVQPPNLPWSSNRVYRVRESVAVAAFGPFDSRSNEGVCYNAFNTHNGLVVLTKEAAEVHVNIPLNRYFSLVLCTARCLSTLVYTRYVQLHPSSHNIVDFQLVYISLTDKDRYKDMMIGSVEFRRIQSCLETWIPVVL